MKIKGINKYHIIADIHPVTVLIETGLLYCDFMGYNYFDYKMN